MLHEDDNNNETERLPQLNKRIAALELANLRQERNEIVAPICRIPDELIIKILTHLHTDIYGGRYLTGHESAHIPICRRLREVALQIPGLWSTIQLGGNTIQNMRQWIALCDKRRGSWPLSLFVDLDNFEHKNLPEMEALSLETQILSIRQQQHRQHPLLTRSWSNLRSLNVISLLNKDDLEQRPRPIGPFLLGGSCNTLTSLDFDGAHVFVQFPHLPALQRLSISWVHHIQWSYRAFECLFGEAKHLREISIHNIHASLGDSSEAGIASNQQLSLPNLSSLSLTGQSDSVLPLWAMLPNPSQKLHIDASHMNNYELTASASDRQLVERLASYMKDTMIGSKHLQYSLLFFVPEETENRSSWFSMRVVPTGHSDCMDNTKGVLSRFHTTCDDILLSMILPHVRAISFYVGHKPRNLMHPLIAAACTHKDVLVLDMSQFGDATWWTDDCLQTLEDYLSRRMEGGVPLESLVVCHGCFWTFDIFDDWEEKGLVQQVSWVAAPEKGWEVDGDSSEG